MNIKNISIIGLGLIGGSIAKALQKSEYDFTISAFDKPEILSEAIDEKVIHSKLSSYEESLNSDLIFLCLPVSKSIEVFETLTPKLNSNSILTDVCSVKNVFKEK